jgi:transcription-repair coupling factor (superfamily II helicase)
VDAHIPHDYVPGERLRLEAYRKIASATDAAGLDSVVEELTDRYGEPPVPVRNLLGVAAFRQACRAHGITEVSMQGSSIRFVPMRLPDSKLVRLRRLYPRAVYKPASQVVSIPRPTEGERLGGPPMRDADLLTWCTRVLTDLASAPLP